MHSLIRPALTTNQKTLFKLSKTFETELSDHHKLILTIMKPVVLRALHEKKFVDPISRWRFLARSNNL